MTQEHDAAGRVTHRSIVPGAGVASDTTFEDFTWDGLGRLTEARNDSTSVTRRHDSLGHVTEETVGASRPS